MKNNFTLLKVLDQLALNQWNDIENRSITDNTQGLKKETISHLVSYAKSVRCHKTKSIDKVLLVLN